MANLTDCLKYFVGLSARDCNCTTLDRPTTYNESGSGFFLDDLMSGIKLQWANDSADCGDNGLWALLDRCRMEGIMAFADAFNQAITQQSKMKHRAFQGAIGTYQANGNYYTNLDATKPLVGVEITPTKNRKGGILKLDNFSINVSSAAVIDVFIYASTAMATPIFSQTTTGSIGTKRHVTVNKKLPLTDSYGNAIRYFIAYDRGAAYPRENRTSCCCGSDSLPWTEWFNVQSFQVSGLPSLMLLAESETAMVRCDYTMSITIEGEIYCDGLSFLCNLDPSFGYGAVVAKTIQLFSINTFLTHLGKSDKVNFYTLMKPEIIAATYRNNATQIEERLRWLSQNIPEQNTDCYLCNESAKLTKHTLLI